MSDNQICLTASDGATIKYSVRPPPPPNGFVPMPEPTPEMITPVEKTKKRPSDGPTIHSSKKAAHAATIQSIIDGSLAMPDSTPKLVAWTASEIETKKTERREHVTALMRARQATLLRKFEDELEASEKTKYQKSKLATFKKKPINKEETFILK